MKTKKILMIAIMIFAITALVFLPKRGTTKNCYTVGFIAPMQHRAMDQIVEGFKDQFQEEARTKLKIDVQNAMGDKILMRSLLSKFISQRYDVIVTVGTETTQIAAQSTQDIPVIGIDVSNDILGGSPNLLGVVESKEDPTIDFLKALKKDPKKIAFVFSQNEKNFDFYQKLKKDCMEKDLLLQPIMIENLSDLYVLKERIQKDSDYIFISKDHIAASGASIISKVAQELGIPFISSDEGSVASGAAAAISNSEYFAGKIGADLVKQLYEGKKVEELSHIEIKKYEVFVNSAQASKQRLDLSDLKNAVSQLPSNPVINERGV